MTLFHVFCPQGFQREQSIFASEFCWFNLHLVSEYSVRVDLEAPEAVCAFCLGPKTEKDLLPKVSRQKRGTESKEVSIERSILDGWY